MTNTFLRAQEIHRKTYLYYCGICQINTITQPRLPIFSVVDMYD